MRHFLHLILLLIAANSFAQEALPKEIDVLVERLKSCDKLWHEDTRPSKRPVPGEAERIERHQTDLRKNHCATLSKDVLRARSKYSAQPKVAAVFDRSLKDGGDQPAPRPQPRMTAPGSEE